MIFEHIYNLLHSFMCKGCMRRAAPHRVRFSHTEPQKKRAGGPGTELGVGAGGAGGGSGRPGPVGPSSLPPSRDRPPSETSELSDGVA